MLCAYKRILPALSVAGVPTTPKSCQNLTRDLCFHLNICSLIRHKVPQVQQTIHCIVTEGTHFNILIAQNNTKKHNSKITQKFVRLLVIANGENNASEAEIEDTGHSRRQRVRLFVFTLLSPTTTVMKSEHERVRRDLHH